METELPFPATSLTGDPGGHLRAAAPETRERTFERHLEDVAEMFRVAGQRDPAGMHTGRIT